MATASSSGAGTGATILAETTKARAVVRSWSRFLLPDEPQPELHRPAIVGGGDGADGRVRDVQIRVAEIRVVQHVEHFPAEFDPRLVDWEPLAERRVDALGAGSPYSVASGRALCAVRGNDVGGQIEPAIRRRVIDVAGVAFAARREVHALRYERPALADVGGRHREREAGAESDDPLHLPAAERVRRQAARRQISPAWTERQFVAAADGGAMALVVARRSFVGVQIPRERSVVRFDLAGAVVDALRELIVPEEEHAGGVALFNPERQAVEA